MINDLKKAYQKKIQESHSVTIAACKKDIEFGKNAATSAAVDGLKEAFFFLEAESSPQVVGKHFSDLGFQVKTNIPMIEGPNKGQVKIIISGWSE